MEAASESLSNTERKPAGGRYPYTSTLTYSSPAPGARLLKPASGRISASLITALPDSEGCALETWMQERAVAEIPSRLAVWHGPSAPAAIAVEGWSARGEVEGKRSGAV